MSASEPNETPEEVFARWTSTRCHKKRRATMEVVDAVCRRQVAGGSTDFTMGTISRLVSCQTPLSEQALNNPKGRSYKELIRAHERAHVPKRRRKTAASDDDFLKGVDNPGHRARMAYLIAETNRLRAECGRERARANAAQKLANTGSAVTLVRGTSPGSGTEARYGLPAKVELTSLERDAMQSLLDSNWLQENGLTADARGRLLSADGSTVLPAGFMTGFAKVGRALGLDG